MSRLEQRHTADMHAWVVTVDIIGAFDRVSQTGVEIKAQEAGIGGNFHLWLKDYLNCRQIQVFVGGHKSDPHAITAGILQGSILLLTLFLIFVRDMDHVPFL